MRWLQWATVDLEKGLGGVEVHARSLSRELNLLGIHSEISSDPQKLKKDWDVIQTHGSAVHFWGTHTASSAIRVHTLHGTTLGRMAACSEWTWPGGYLASLREFFGVLRADVVLAIHSDLWLFKLARILGKTCAVCSNGWDSATDQDVGDLPASGVRSWVQDRLPFWSFIGRGGDPVKATWRVKSLIRDIPSLRIAAAPGDGFEPHSQVQSTGRLDAPQVKELLAQSKGLLLTSKYEGLPLVVLESLAMGTPVLATPVGGLNSLNRDLQGFKLLEFNNEESGSAWSGGVAELEALPGTSEARKKRAEWNRKFLKTWRQVAQCALDAVLRVKK
ncbi:MAG: glycosyltransferase [Bdellovibrio sp.]|nr:glycosyltransferase [Bdellovibrio sp.]